MSTLEIIVGAHRDWPLQCWLQGGQTAATFASTDTLSAVVYRGQDQTSLFAPTVAWYTAGSTQTGYDQGQVQLTVPIAQSALLEANGTFPVTIYRTPQGSSEESAIWRGALLALPAVGTSTEATITYCSYQDLLDVGEWITTIQNLNTDVEGWYNQRLRAREWMDWTIINNYRGAYVGLFEQMSTLAFEFGYAGWRRSLGPSPSLVDYLQQNLLIIRPQIVQACTHYALAKIGLKQIGINNQYAAYGSYHRDQATRELIGITAEIDLNGDGIGELFVNLSSTNTLFT